MDRQRFLEACIDIVGKERVGKGIGTLSEKTLHAVLKKYFEHDETKHEIKVGRYVADIASEQGITEIQTRSFNALRDKLAAFLELCEVRVVYPIPYVKWLCWIDSDTGEITKKRKSPKRGNIYDAIFELYKIKPQLANPNLQICIVLVKLTEYRYLNGWSQDKKKGSSRCDGIPSDIFDEIYVGGSNGFWRFIPSGLGAPFDSSDYAKAAKISRRKAQVALNILTEMGEVVRVGKNGNAILYDRCINTENVNAI